VPSPPEPCARFRRPFPLTCSSANGRRLLEASTDCVNILAFLSIALYRCCLHSSYRNTCPHIRRHSARISYLCRGPSLVLGISILPKDCAKHRLCLQVSTTLLAMKTPINTPLTCLAALGSLLLNPAESAVKTSLKLQYKDVNFSSTGALYTLAIRIFSSAFRHNKIFLAVLAGHLSHTSELLSIVMLTKCALNFAPYRSFINSGIQDPHWHLRRYVQHLAVLDNLLSRTSKELFT
jgi:hypothetical protein